MLIRVKRQHIKEARTKNCTNCPIELAIYESTGYLSDVGSENVGIKKDSLRWDFLLPRSARRFINRFDNNKPVKPFNFILNLEGV